MATTSFTPRVWQNLRQGDSIWQALRQDFENEHDLKAKKPLSATSIFHTAVFIGRFQPFHAGHLHIVERALLNAEYLLLLVGSAGEPRSLRNPFTYEEREKMIYNALPIALRERVIIKPLSDYTYDDNAWIHAVERRVYDALDYREHSIALVGHNKDESTYYLDLFPDWSFIEVENLEGINATTIREAYFASAPNLPTKQPSETTQETTETTAEDNDINDANELNIIQAVKLLSANLATEIEQHLEAEQAKETNEAKNTHNPDNEQNTDDESEEDDDDFPHVIMATTDGEKPKIKLKHKKKHKKKHKEKAFTHILHELEQQDEQADETNEADKSNNHQDLDTHDLQTEIAKVDQDFDANLDALAEKSATNVLFSAESDVYAINQALQNAEQQREAVFNEHWFPESKWQNEPELKQLANSERPKDHIVTATLKNTAQTNKADKAEMPEETVATQPHVAIDDSADISVDTVIDVANDDSPLSKTFNRVLAKSTRNFLTAFQKTTDFQMLSEDFAAVNAFKKPWQNTPYPVIFTTADALVRWCDEILLVIRKHAPSRGRLALPGGFIQASETLENAAIRELFEETQLPVEKTVLHKHLKAMKTFDDPSRSARGRIVTHAFYFDVSFLPKRPEPVAADDAQTAAWYRIDSLNKQQFFEDHYFIIQTLLKESK